jgi:hypothetical protein
MTPSNGIENGKRNWIKKRFSMRFSSNCIEISFIAYGKLTAVLVESIKAQQLQIERLENLIPDNNQK